MARKLLDKVTDKIRLKGYSYKTEKSYVGWVKRFILFHNRNGPHFSDSGLRNILDRLMLL